MLYVFFGAWFLCALVWVAAMCAAAHTPQPRNTRKHNLGKWLGYHRAVF